MNCGLLDGETPLALPYSQTTVTKGIIRVIKGVIITNWGIQNYINTPVLNTLSELGLTSSPQVFFIKSPVLVYLIATYRITYATLLAT